jgi:uncharacterized protein
MEIVGELLETTMVQDLKLYTQHYSTTRLEHSLNVSYNSYKVAKFLGTDYAGAARVGLLHDLFYYYQGDVTFSERGHLYNHSRIAVMNARVITDLTPKEEDAIVKHMFGTVTFECPRHLIGWILTLVDKQVAIKEALLGFKNKAKKLATA